MTPAEQQQYIEKVAALAVKIAPLFGRKIISPVIGQFCKESAFGTSELAVKATNHAGMKYRGDRCPHAIPDQWYLKDAGEQRPDGTKYTVPNAAWYMFKTLEDCMYAYFEFTSIDIYKPLRECTEAKKYCDLLYSTGYATGVGYSASLWNDYVVKYNLQKYDAMLNASVAPNRLIKIMLDAGHYGKYNRSPVLPEYYESDFTWKHHLYLKAELEQYGFEVGTTRASKDGDLGLTARGRKAEGYDLFISLHSNACGTESVDRVEGIYLVDDGCSADIHKQSKEIATLLCDTVKPLMGATQPSKIYNKVSASDRNANGKLDDEHYGVLYGTHQVGVTGIIIEHGFHTNLKEAQWLAQDANVKKLAIAEAKALAQYYSMKPAENPTINPSNPYPEPSRTIKMEPADDVKWVQWELQESGYNTGAKITGVFDERWDEALRAYQADHNLTVDGKCGWGTRTSLLANK